MAEEANVSTSSSNSKREITIYNCAQCHALIGNSDFLIRDYGDAKFIYLSEVENAILTTSLRLLSTGNDKGCKYRILQCQQCRDDIGIHYVSVSPELIRLNNAYKLFISAINSKKTVIFSPPEQNNAAILAELADHKSKLEDVAVMLVDACRDRCLIKNSIMMHAECLKMLKAEIDELKGQDPNTESS